MLLDFERRLCEVGGCQVLERTDGEPVLVGYAAVFYDGTPRTEFELYSGLVERVQRGAFERAIGEDDVRALFNHSENQILGRNTAKTLRLLEDKTGLRYEIDLPDTATGRDVATAVQRGDISGSSFAFRVKREQFTEVEEGATVRDILEVAPLYDVGPVTYPAYKATSAAMRAEDELTELRSRVDAWRADEAGGVAGGELTQAERDSVAVRGRVAELEVSSGKTPTYGELRGGRRQMARPPVR
jgi:HK97 family phage prohead protease